MTFDIQTIFYNNDLSTKDFCYFAIITKKKMLIKKRQPKKI